MMQSGKKNTVTLLIISAVILLTVFIALVTIITGFSESASEKELETVKNNLVRTAISCYALEGAFPKDIDYLAENYGFSLNRDKYVYCYEYQGANLIPNIKVFSLEGGVR